MKKRAGIFRTTNGIEERRCAKCGQFFPADAAHFYTKRGNVQSHCRPCARQDARERQRTAYVPGSRSKVPSAPKQSFDASALVSAMKEKP